MSAWKPLDDFLDEIGRSHDEHMSARDLSRARLIADPERGAPGSTYSDHPKAVENRRLRRARAARR